MTPDMPKFTISRTISIGNIIQIILILAALAGSYFHTQSRIEASETRIDTIEKTIQEHIRNHDAFVRADVQAIRESTDEEWKREMRERLARVEQKLDAHMNK